MKVIVVGFGKMGMLHTALFNVHKDTEVVAVVDKEKKILNIFNKLNNRIKTYNSISKLTSEEVFDCAVITTPHYLHLPILEALKKKPIHVLIEKPLVHDYNIINNYKINLEIQERSAVGYCMRFHPTFNFAKKLLIENKIGNVQSYNSKHFIASITKKISGWRTNVKKAGGGALITNGSHLVDLLFWYFGMPVSVFGKSQFIYNKEVEDAFFGSLIYQNGIIGNLETDWSRTMYRIPYTSIEITGQHGTITVDDDKVELIINSAKGGAKQGRYIYNSIDLYKGSYFDIAGGYYSAQTNAFINFAKTGDIGDLSSFEHAVEVQSIIEAFYRSNNSDSKIVKISNL